MAIKIPIITVFDSKGLKQAQYQLNKVRGNFQSLGRNFAIAGAAFAGAAAIIGKSAKDLARIEKINAQTEAVLKSMGNSAGVSSQHIQDLAGNLEKLTASEAETIQEGANLLLTFRNIQNQVGTNNDIFDQAVKMSVDLSRAMGTTASGEAIRLGKALNDPVKGVSALTRVGVSFTEQQKEQIKTLSESGDMLGAQKIILSELQAQFGGSGQAYAATFAGQVQLLNHELGALGEEATLIVMPALRDMVGALRELAPEIGEKMKAAIASVDWKAFTKTIVDLITFLVQNAETIMRVVTAMFLLNTAYNVGKVAVGLYNAAAVILGNTFTVTAGKIGLSTGALKLFRTAMITSGIGAFVVALGFIIEGATEVDSTYRQTTPVVTSFGDELRKTGEDSAWAAGQYGVAKSAIEGLNSAAANFKAPDIGNYIDAGERKRNLDVSFAQSTMGNFDKNPDPIPKGVTAKTSSLAQTLKREATLVKKETKLISAGVSEGLAARLVSGAAPVKRANKALANITKNNGKLTKSLKKMEKNLKTATGAAVAAEVETVAVIEDTSVADALAAKEKAYASFSDSVASTFSSIKNSILDAFSLPELGGSTDSIIRNMDKLLSRVKAFSQNITKLSSMGLDPKLLQQVINAGPIAGAKLAANLVAGGAGGLAAINSGFSELGGLAGDIGMTGTQAQFGTSSQQNIYNVNINGGLDTGASIGKAVVDAVKAYERTSGAVWQGA